MRGKAVKGRVAHTSHCRLPSSSEDSLPDALEAINDEQDTRRRNRLRHERPHIHILCEDLHMGPTGVRSVTNQRWDSANTPAALDVGVR